MSNCCNGQQTHRICGDFDTTDQTDLGQCFPYRVKRSCDAPTLPTNECDEADPVVEYDPETEVFTVLTILYDSECSPISDSTGSNILTLVA